MKALVAQWSLMLLCVSMAAALGGGLYESFVLIPLWSKAPPSSFAIIQPGAGGLGPASGWRFAWRLEPRAWRRGATRRCRVAGPRRRRASPNCRPLVPVQRHGAAGAPRVSGSIHGARASWSVCSLGPVRVRPPPGRRTRWRDAVWGAGHAAPPQRAPGARRRWPAGCSVGSRAAPTRPRVEQGREHGASRVEGRCIVQIRSVSHEDEILLHVFRDRL